MKRRPLKMLRTAALPLLGGCVVIAVLAGWQAGIFQPRVQRLIRQLQTAKDAEDRYKAARELGEMGDEARPAVPALVAALQDDGRHVTATMMIFPQELYVRNAAYQALSKIRWPETVDALIRLIADGTGSGESRRPIRDGVPVAEADSPAERSEGESSSAGGRRSSGALRPHWSIVRCPVIPKQNGCWHSKSCLELDVRSPMLLRCSWNC